MRQFVNSSKIKNLLALMCVSGTLHCGLIENFNRTYVPQSKQIVVRGDFSSMLLTTEKYKDCNDLTNTQIQRLIAYNQRAKDLSEGPRVDASVNNSVPTTDADQASVAAGTNGQTNVQEQGVDEGDFVKIGQNQIVIIKTDDYERSSLHVMDRVSLQKIGEIKLDYTPVEIYIADEQLIILGEQRDTNESILDVYKLRSGKLPKLVHSVNYPDSNIVASRIRGDILLIALNLNSGVGYAYDEKSKILTENKYLGRECDDIVKSPIDYDLPDMMSDIVTIKLNDDFKQNELIMEHGSDMLYVGQENIYISAAYNDYFDAVTKVIDEVRPNGYSVVHKIALDEETGELSIAASGLFDGVAKDQWAFKELQDSNYLAVATTSRSGDVFEGFNLINVFSVLHQDNATLKAVQKPIYFAKNEDIRAVRYVGETAYVVTFEKTDPLFAFDLANPDEPKQLGELKIPGFSTYLHPVEEGKLLGVGFDADDVGSFSWSGGLKVSLFDVKSPTQMAELDHLILGERGSYSETNYDHHAFFFDKDAGIFAIPVNLYSFKSQPDVVGAFGDKLQFSGALVYKLDDDHIGEVARLTHNDLLPKSCKTMEITGVFWGGWTPNTDIRRVFSLDQKLLTISDFAIRTYDLANPTQVLQTEVYDAGDVRGRPCL